MGKNKVFSKTALVLAAMVVILALSGCSHNAAVFGFGKVFKVGNMEYELLYVNGIGIIDYSRENSSWEMEIDDDDGLSYDVDTHTIKGIKKVKRTIGTQITGYLVDLAKADAEAAEAYVSKDPLSTGIPQQKTAEAVIPNDPLK